MESRNNPVVTAATSHGVLPLDVMFDVLLRLPAKEICRLRTVCRPWRSLTFDPAFIKAHAARQPGPLIVAYYHDRQRRRRGEREVVHVMDLSGGGVIKQVPIPSGQTLMCSHLDLICVGDFDTSQSCYMIDSATEAACRLDVNCFRDPLCLSYWDHDECLDPAYSVFALGRVDSTGEYKMLMVSCLVYGEHHEDHYRCHVVTVNGAGGTRWRPTACPGFPIQMDMKRGVVFGRAAYYLAADSEFHFEALESGGALDLIASFDFETEHWSTITVPRLVDEDNGNHYNINDEDAKINEYTDKWEKSALSELKGYLVLAHNNLRYSSSLDLWFLKNIENRLWVKEYSIQDPGRPIPVHENSALV